MFYKVVQIIALSFTFLFRTKVLYYYCIIIYCLILWCTTHVTYTLQLLASTFDNQFC